jgi:hypothetical protein
MKLNHNEIVTLVLAPMASLVALSTFAIRSAFAALSVFATLSTLAYTATAQDQLLWGDTHLHSSNSTDAYLFGNMTADPETAYRFARGLPVVHPGHRARGRSIRPLLVIADHAEGLGALR